MRLKRSFGRSGSSAVTAQPLASTVMIIATVIGLIFMAVGLPPAGGVCFIIALVCALTLVIKAVDQKRHE